MGRRHRELQRKVAKKRGKTEVPVKVGRKKGKLDATTQSKAVEIERSCDSSRIAWALRKLSKSGKSNKVLQVNYRCIPKAQEIKRELRLRGIKIKKLTDTV